MLWAVSERAWILLLDLSFTTYLHRCHGHHHHQQFTKQHHLLGTTSNYALISCLAHEFFSFSQILCE